MAKPSPRSAADDSPAQPQEADRLRDLLLAPGYLKLLVLCALIGIPVSLAAFWFLVALHELEHLLWDELPHALGWDTPTWWWPLPLFLVAGVVVGLIAVRLPGAGGHIPALGLHTGGASPSTLPGVLLASVASLPFGAVLGPEAPLIALGGCLALLFRNLARAPATPQSTMLLGAAGAAAAIAAIFGNPLVAAILLMEIGGVAGPQLFAVMLPALLSSGVGALVFSGFGRWTGLETGSLSLELPESSARPDVGDIVWTLVLAVAIAVAMRLVLSAGRRVASFVRSGVWVRTVVCALGAAVCAALYTLITDRSPAEVASSGQSTLSALANDPHAWSVGALLAVLLFKSAAYALCLGSLRGGPVFPALFLGAAIGVLLAPLPGFGTVPAMAVGMAAATTATLKLPVSSVVLVALLLDSPDMMPLVILATVIAFITTELLQPNPGKAGGQLPSSGSETA